MAPELVQELGFPGRDTPTLRYWVALMEHGCARVSHGLSAPLSDHAAPDGERDLPGGLLQFAAAASSRFVPPV